MNDPEALIHYIDVLLKESNFTQAAHELHISQPYLTQLIKRIEKRLGTQIINRSSTPFSLTKAGDIYYKYLESIIHNDQKLKEELTPFVYPDKEVIRIGVSENLGSIILPKLLPNFLMKNPNIKIQLVEAPSRRSKEQLLNQQIDSYIGQTAGTVTQEFDSFFNGKEKCFIVIPAKSKYFKREQLLLNSEEYDLKKILQEPFVLGKPTSAIGRQINAIFQKFHVKLNAVLESDNIFTIAKLAINGAGLTILPASVINEIKHPMINLIPLDPKLIQIKYFIAVNHNSSKTKGISKLIKTFKQLKIEQDIK